MKRENVFTAFIDLLGVKHTVAYSNRYFNEHPHKYNLFGLSKMLSDYGVENAGLRITDKNDIYRIETPFIAHIDIEFVVVTKVTTEKVHFLTRAQETIVNTPQFLDLWSGVVLIAEPDENSIEPNYPENRKKEKISQFQKIILFAAVIALGVVSIILLGSYCQPGIMLLFLLNGIGAGVGYLLILKQLKIHS